MAVEPQKLNVTVNERESVTALLYSASPRLKRDRAGITVLLGHGAGASQTSSFMRLFADGLATRGFDAMTFNFLYTEQGRRSPDPKARLESCCRAVILAAHDHNKLKGNRLVIGGKSMGGRIASQVAAAVQAKQGMEVQATRNRSTSIRKIDTVGEANQLPEAHLGPEDIAGLVFLGYPLHPPGKPDQLRAEHLKHIRAPMLFVQGSRDAFGTPDELGAIIKNFHLPATLHVIEGGDHSFSVLKSSSVPQQQVYETAMDEIAQWLRLR
jgi:predicted alpha/beta-hydrolase family hydrolase